MIEIVRIIAKYFPDIKETGRYSIVLDEKVRSMCESRMSAANMAKLDMPSDC